MAWTVLYDGSISGSTIATAIAAVSGSSIITIPSANGQRVLIMKE